MSNIRQVYIGQYIEIAKLPKREVQQVYHVCPNVKRCNQAKWHRDKPPAELRTPYCPMCGKKAVELSVTIPHYLDLQDMIDDTFDGDDQSYFTAAKFQSTSFVPPQYENYTLWTITPNASMVGGGKWFSSPAATDFSSKQMAGVMQVKENIWWKGLTGLLKREKIAYEYKLGYLLFGEGQY